MPLTAAEKQRRYRERIKADPERQQLHLEKERQRWHASKGKSLSRLPAAEMGERDKRQKRRYWKKKKQDSRKRQKFEAALIDRTPPDSPPVVVGNPQNRPRREIGQRIQRRNKAKCYRDNKKLTEALQVERKKAEKYKKRYNRLAKRKSSDIPRSKTRHLLKHLYVNDAVKRTLNFHFALIAELKAKYHGTKLERQKQVLASMITGKIIKRYKLQSYASNKLGFSQKRWKHFRLESNSAKNFLHYQKQPKNMVKVCKLQKLVRNYFLRDDVSRTTAGKKETVTRNKTKMQKRFLCDTMKILHSKFLSEYPSATVSYSLFCRLRPYWVLIPTVKDSDTCLCKTHENIGLIVQRLSDLRVLQTTDIAEMADSLACDKKSMACMYGKCPTCANNQYAVNEGFDEAQETEYWQWVSEKSERITKTGDIKEQRITRKEKLTTRVVDLVDDFQKQLRKFQRHVFNIRHQFSALKSLKEKLTEKEALIQIDFAENYLCRYSSEIQSVHFGGSHKQVTLHDVVVQVGDVADAIPMCTISASTQHDPPAIWQYLDPVFAFLKANYPQVDKLHFYSDGPSTQFRQKKNFFLFSTLLFQHGYKLGTWNFFEAGHGKGSPDGVGGSVKRTADKIITCGVDIPDAATLYKVLQESTIKLFYTDPTDVDEASERLPLNIPAVPGTMSIHQVLTSKLGKIQYRNISCFCGLPETIHCHCHGIKDFNFNVTAITNRNVISTSSDADLNPLDIADPHIVGKWCVVSYEDHYYPGTIMDVDEQDVEVRCMAAIGVNRFFWPLIDDVIWYSHEKIVCVIDEPQKIGSRHVQIDKNTWSLTSSKRIDLLIDYSIYIIFTV